MKINRSYLDRAILWLGFLPLLLPGLCAAKVPAPLTSALDLASTPSLGGQATVIWTGLPRLTPGSAQVVFVLTAPGAAPVAVAQPVQLVAGRVAAASHQFPLGQPGVYAVVATAVMKTPTGQYAQSRQLLLDVPAGGPAHLVREEALSAGEFNARFRAPEPKRAASAAPSYVSFSGFTISGTLKYTDKVYSGGSAFSGTAAAPVRRVLVEIRDRQGTSSRKLASTRTDNNGNFSATLSSNNDGDGTGMDLYLRLVADGPEAVVQDMNLSTYYYDTATRTDWAGGNLALGTITLSQTASAPWNIFDTILRGFDTVKSLGSTPSKVKLAWEVGNTEVDVTHFNPSEMRIYLQGVSSDPDEFDDAVILHEYGHFLEDTFAYSKNPGGNHFWASPSNRELAWSEGWSTFFSCAVRSTKLYFDSMTGGWLVVDLELPSDNPRGDSVEGAIAASLWDVCDYSNDLNDFLAGGLKNVWFIFNNYFTSSRACVMKDFYDGWKAYGYADRPLLQSILTEHGIVYDWSSTLPKISSLSINNGAASTASRAVTLNNACSGSPASYIASESSNFTGASWLPYSTAPKFTITSANNGTKTIYLRVKNAAGLVSAIRSDTITLNESTAAPVVNSFSINNGASSTASRTVTLNNVCSGSPAWILASESSAFSGAVWQTYATAASFKIASAGNGTKTIYFKVKNYNGQVSNTRSDTITLNEVVAPLVSSFKIANGAASSLSRTVTLNNTCSGSPKYYMASESSSFSGASWLTYATAPGFKISSTGNGTKTIYFKVKNSAGVASAVVKDTIVLDESVTLTVGGSTVTGSIAGSTDYDVYQFKIGTSGWYTIRTDQDTLKDGYMFLYDSNWTKLAESDDQAMYKMPLISRYFSAGTYFIEFEGNASTDVGKYTIKISSGSVYKSVSAGGSSVSGDITWEWDVDWFKFTVSTAGAYTIETFDSGLADGMMYLYREGDIYPLAFNDQWMKYANNAFNIDLMPMISTTLMPGTYTVAVMGYSETNLGKYSLRVRSGNSGVTFQTLVTNWLPLNGSLSSTSDRDYYLFSVDEDGSYTINSASGTLKDGKMTLYEMLPGTGGDFYDFNEVAQNDDASSTNLMPKITAQLTKGEYMVEYSGYSSGTYTIDLRH